jgi:hypothetical protein
MPPGERAREILACFRGTHRRSGARTTVATPDAPFGRAVAVERAPGRRMRGHPVREAHRILNGAERGSRGPLCATVEVG